MLVVLSEEILRQVRSPTRTDGTKNISHENGRNKKLYTFFVPPVAFFVPPVAFSWDRKPNPFLRRAPQYGVERCTTTLRHRWLVSTTYTRGSDGRFIAM